MWTWPSIIDALGGTGEVALALSQGNSTVSGWRKRGIPSTRWSAITRLAADKGRSDISLEILAELAAREPAEVRA